MEIKYKLPPSCLGEHNYGLEKRRIFIYVCVCPHMEFVSFHPVALP